MYYIFSWLYLCLIIVLLGALLKGIEVKKLSGGLWAALVLSVLNVFFKPLLLILSFPVNWLTLGLFTWVINTLLIMLTAWLSKNFNVKNFWWALLMAFGLAVSYAFKDKLFKLLSLPSVVF